MGFKPEPPAPPNPYQVAVAQTNTNVSTAVANTALGNANETSPTGSVTYNQVGTYSLDEPNYNDAGVEVSRSIRQIPKFERIVTLSASQQILFDQSNTIRTNMNAIALSQVDRIDDTLAEPFVFENISPAGTAPAAPVLTETTTRLPIVTEFGTTDLEAARTSVQTAIDARLQYQIGLDREAEEVRLLERGVLVGSTAYERAMIKFAHAATDANVQAYLAAGQEVTRMRELEIRTKEAANRAQQQDFSQRIVLMGTSNEARVKLFAILRDLADFASVKREREIQESLLLRTQPLNEVSQLSSGGQAQIPQFTQYKAGTIANTDLAGMVYQSAQMDVENYKQKVAQQNAMIGAVAAIGGAALGAPMSGGGSVGGSLMGKMGF